MEAPDDEAALRFFAPRPHYEIARFLVLRALGALYAIAFLILILQGPGLIGSRGLLPAAKFVGRVTATFGLRGAFFRVPSLFFFLGAGDRTLTFFAWLGLLLSLLVTLGLTNAVAQLALWAIYLSFIDVGQVFYGYGWESQLVETGFLAVFLCPMVTFGPFPRTAVPRVPIWLSRWLIFRIMLGSGLIKLRGDPCWRDLTCLVYHYETQPIPNPLSPLLHSLPVWAHKLGALWNHLVEIVVPFFAFAPKKARHVAGGLLVAFQVILILSGNLSFLNWLTIVPAITCFDDSLLGKLVPRRLRERLGRAAEREPPRAARFASYAYLLVAAALSIGPVLNLLSSRQAMNTSFEPFRLVNTYGAFGSVGRERYEIILEGTDARSVDERTVWRPYEFPCKPGDPMRRPCVAAPYHYRLDWQMWFASFGGYKQEPWLVFLCYKLLRGEPEIKTLLANDPFPSAPPTFIRAELYRYELRRVGEEGPGYWRRQYAQEVLRPLSVNDPDMLRFLAAHGFIDGPRGAPVPIELPGGDDEDEPQ